MSTLWKRALATTTIALVAGIGLTACDSGENTTTEPKGTSQTSTEPKEEPKASGVMTADDFGQRVNDAQYEAGSAHFTQTATVSGQQIQMNGDMVIDEDPSKIKLAMTMDGGMEIRVVEGETYINMGEVTGNKFYHPTGEDDPIASQLESSLDQMNIGEQMKVFKAALKDFQADENAETIDGVDTTKYTLTLDSKKLFESQGTEIPEEAGIGDTIEYVMFVGDDDLPRRMVMDLAGTSMTMEFSKWGEDVTVEAPPADQVTDQMPGM